MTAARTEHRDTLVGGVNAVMRRDGSMVHLDDIATAAEGQALLEEVDAAILSIEEQLETWTEGRGDPDWSRRARSALKRKRRIRPPLQQRIAVLRKAEKQADPPPFSPRVSPRHESIEARRVAFINAAEELLDHEVFVEIWSRAAERQPEALADRGGAADVPA